MLLGMRIAVVSDTHLAPRVPAFGADWAVVAAWIDGVAPDVVVHLGDVSADGASDPGEFEKAESAAERAVQLAPEYRQRGNQAWALWMLGEVVARRSHVAVGDYDPLARPPEPSVKPKVIAHQQSLPRSDPGELPHEATGVNGRRGLGNEGEEELVVVRG